MLDSGLKLSKANLFAANVYMEYGSFIRKTIRCNLKDEYQADDIFQNFFLHLIVSPVPNDIEHIESYLYRTVVNCIAENKRQTAYYQTHMKKYAETVNSVEAEIDPAIAVIDDEKTANIFGLIRKQLPHKECLAIILRYKNNCNICEIAEAMDVKTDSVRRYISRGLKKLRSSLISKEVFAFGDKAVINRLDLS